MEDNILNLKTGKRIKTLNTQEYGCGRQGMKQQKLG